MICCLSLGRDEGALWLFLFGNLPLLVGGEGRGGRSGMYPVDGLPLGDLDEFVFFCFSTVGVFWKMFAAAALSSCPSPATTCTQSVLVIARRKTKRKVRLRGGIMVC